MENIITDVEKRVELMNVLKSFKDNDFVNKEEEIAVLNYLLTNSNTYLFDMIYQRGLSAELFIHNIINDFDPLCGDVFEARFKKQIAKLEEENEELSNSSFELNVMNKKYSDVIDENEVLKKKIKLYESIEQLRNLKKLDGGYSLAIELLEASMLKQKADLDK